MASRSINRAQILGNLTRDPELKYTPTGAPVCTFGVATNRSWATTEGQTREETQYHRVVAWNKLAELCAKLLSKGRKVYVEGRIAYRTFTGKDGNQRSITEIVLDDFIVFSDGKRMTPDEGEKVEEPKEVTATEETPTPAEESTPSKKSDDDETINPEDIPF